MKRWIVAVALALALAAGLVTAGACVRQVVLDPDGGDPDAHPFAGPDASFVDDAPPADGPGALPDAAVLLD